MPRQLPIPQTWRAQIPSARPNRNQVTGAGLWGLPAEQPTQAIIQPTQAPPSGGAVCNCTGPDLDCGNFADHKQAQDCYNYCKSQGLGDVFELDRDGNGLACESLP